MATQAALNILSVFSTPNLPPRRVYDYGKQCMVLEPRTDFNTSSNRTAHVIFMDFLCHEANGIEWALKD